MLVRKWKEDEVNCLYQLSFHHSQAMEQPSLNVTKENIWLSLSPQAIILFLVVHNRWTSHETNFSYFTFFDIFLHVLKSFKNKAATVTLIPSYTLRYHFTFVIHFIQLSLMCQRFSCCKLSMRKELSWELLNKMTHSRKIGCLEQLT